jgi:vacuole morphology and inheritance protein 14
MTAMSCELISPTRLERLVREASAAKDHDKIRKIVEQLCHDFAYAVHQPHARNGGLIGLAAASIALGSVRAYLQPRPLPRLT